MKLIILVPSREYLENAGVRIRYARLLDAFADSGVDLSMVELSAFDPAKAACDVVLVSKCYDALALVAVAVLAQRGIPVGIDLFDDYFSQKSDSRLRRFRNWLRQMLRLSDFALCSTPAMCEILRGYRGDLPVHVLNDPAPKFNAAAVAKALDTKTGQAKTEGVIRLAWFGVGDNPYFGVGLNDIAAFGSWLSQLAARDIAVELTVLTNRRALDGEGLALTAQLPIPTAVHEWSEQREADLLNRSLACFLPVNAQPFSTAKSLNRALTALTAGCQVLAVGYPLYAPLGRFIYRDPNNLVEDLRAQDLRLSPRTLPEFEELVSDVGSPSGEASRLAAFLDGVARDRAEAPASDSPIFLIHGFATSRSAHDAAKSAGILSVATPFCRAPLEFDAFTRLGPGGDVALFVCTRALSRLAPNFRARSNFEHRIGRRKFLEFGKVGPAKAAEPRTMSLPLQLALYEPVVRQTISMLSGAFGPGRAIVSENSPLPFEAMI